MKIHNEAQREQLIKRIEELVAAVENYDDEKNVIPNKEPVEHYVKGSLGTYYYSNKEQAYPRGVVFFRHITKNSDTLTPTETGMSPGRCPI
jgi:hypothetical protein